MFISPWEAHQRELAEREAQQKEAEAERRKKVADGKFAYAHARVAAGHAFIEERIRYLATVREVNALRRIGEHHRSRQHRLPS